MKIANQWKVLCILVAAGVVTLGGWSAARGQTEVAKLTADDAAAGDEFSHAVAIPYSRHDCLTSHQPCLRSWE